MLNAGCDMWKTSSGVRVLRLVLQSTEKGLFFSPYSVLIKQLLRQAAGGKNT